MIEIQIQRDMTRGILSLSQKTYINKVLDRCSMKIYYKGNNLSLLQCSKNDLQKEQMKDLSYASAVESLMYAQVCIHLDITYTVEKLGRYLINSEINHWKTAKKVMRYLQNTNEI